MQCFSSHCLAEQWTEAAVLKDVDSNLNLTGFPYTKFLAEKNDKDYLTKNMASFISLNALLKINFL